MVSLIFNNRYQLWLQRKDLIDKHNNLAAQGLETYTLGENDLLDLVNID